MRFLTALALTLLAACAQESGVGPAGSAGGVLTPGVQPALNDTGVTVFIDNANDGTAPLTYDRPPAGWENQDAAHGRDAVASDDSDGRAGFRFTKLDGEGRPLPADAPAWDCVRDEITGLVWEVKTDDPSDPRFAGHTFSWYDPDPDTNGGHPGERNQGNCQATLENCDTQGYRDYVNDRGLCGYKDWRLPTVPELLSLVDYGAPAEPLIDTRFFPHTIASDHWSSQTVVGGYCLDYRSGQTPTPRIDNGAAWEVHFDRGHAEGHCKWDNRGAGQVSIHLRLVRGG